MTLGQKMCKKEKTKKTKQQKNTPKSLLWELVLIIKFSSIYQNLKKKKKKRNPKDGVVAKYIDEWAFEMLER